MTKKLTWALIGASNIAERVLPAIRKVPLQEVCAVFSNSHARAQAFAQQFDIPHAYTDLQELLSVQKPDVVYISSTNEHHHAQAMQAIAAGCQVLCEKPLAMTEAHALEMVQAAAQAHVVLATNHHLRAALAHEWMREQLQMGLLGKVHGVQVSHAVYLPAHLQGWRLTSPGAGGGVLLDILVHDLDLLRYLLQKDPVSIQTLTQCHGMAQAGLEDSGMNLIEFEDGILAQTHESFVAQFAKTRLHILGTEGNLYAEGSLTQAGTARVWLRNAQGETEIPFDACDLYVRTVTAFVDAIHGRGHPLADGWDGYKSMATALAGLRSAQSGQKVPVQFI
jgi:1,5-anhydro-D-fructose reductase (1,5-anhydro-D-mannitol-forming)